MKKVVIELISGKIACEPFVTAKRSFNQMYGLPEGKNIYQTDLDNLVHFSHLSNVVHVLMGQRPVPSKKRTFRKRNEYIDSIVNGGLFKITNVPYVISTDAEGNKKKVFYKEFTQGKKMECDSKPNSIFTKDPENNSVKGYVTWDKLYKRSLLQANASKFQGKLIDLSKSIGIENVTKEYPLIDFLYFIKKNEAYREDIIEYIKGFGNNSGLTPFLNYLCGINDIMSLNDNKAPNLAGLAINHSCLHKITVNGEMILFMEDKDAEVIENGMKFATFLDGGLAKVKSVSRFYEDDMDDDIEGYIEKDFVEIKNLVK